MAALAALLVLPYHLTGPTQAPDSIQLDNGFLTGKGALPRRLDEPMRHFEPLAPLSAGDRICPGKVPLAFYPFFDALDTLHSSRNASDIIPDLYNPFLPLDYAGISSEPGVLGCSTGLTLWSKTSLGFDTYF